MTLRTATASGLASVVFAGADFTGADTFDTNGYSITQDIDLIAGSTAASSGPGVRVRNGGTWYLPDGKTLTTRGFNNTRSTSAVGAFNGSVPLQVDTGGTFTHQGGGTVVVSAKNDTTTGGNLVALDGLYQTDVANGKLAVWDGDPANRSWANQSVAAAFSGTVAWYPLGNVYVTQARTWLANAAGTGPGSMLDNSLVLSGTDASAIFVRQVATPELLLPSASPTAGDYAVDYETGMVYWYHPTKGASAVASWASKYLTVSIGYQLDCTSAAAGAQALINGIRLWYCGAPTAGGPVFGLRVRNKKSAGTGVASRLFYLKNSDLRYSYKPFTIEQSDGTAADPLLVQNNYFGHAPDGDPYGAAISAYAQNGVNGSAAAPFATYITFDRNTLNLAGSWFRPTSPQYKQVLLGWKFTNNTGRCQSLLLVTAPPSDIRTAATPTIFAGCEVSGNDTTGYSIYFQPNWMQGAEGQDAANLLTIKNNTYRFGGRGANLGQFTDCHDNKLLGLKHHGHIVGISGGTHYIQRLRVWNETFAHVQNDCAGIMLGYNNCTWLDDVVIANCTINGTGIDLADNTDPSNVAILTKAVLVNNLSVNAALGVNQKQLFVKASDAFNKRVRTQFTRLSHNAAYNYLALYSGLSHQADVYWQGGAALYNEDLTRACRGVTLYDPTYAAAPGAGKALVLTIGGTVTAPTVTVAWDGGTPVSYNAPLGSGTATAGAATSLTDTSKTWLASSTNNNAANCPSGKWILITSGTGAGQIRAVLTNTATVLTTLPAWTTIPDATSTYTILEVEQQLTAADATNKVRAALDLRDFPQVSNQLVLGAYTDAGITLVYSEPATNPLLPTGTANSFVASDYVPPGGSPLLAAGVAIAGVTPTVDAAGRTRPAAPAIGAFDLALASVLGRRTRASTHFIARAGSRSLGGF